MVFKRPSIFFLLLLNLLCCGISDAAKILVFGTSNSKSHMISAGRIVEVLSKHGHNVTFATLEVGHSITRFSGATHNQIVPFGYVTPEEERAHIEHVADLTTHVFAKSDLQKTHVGISKFMAWLVDACDKALIENATTIEQLRNEKFDALVTEQLSACGSGLTEILNIPVHFLVSSCALADDLATAFGVPVPTGYVPAAMTLTAITDTMTFAQRANNLLESEVMAHAMGSSLIDTTKVFRKHYGQNFPDISDIIIKKTPFVFINIDDLIEFPRPWPPNVIRVGGLGMNFNAGGDLKNLAEPFASEMQKGAKGVVFFSMGSNANTAGFPEPVKKNLFGTMMKFKDYHFILKLDKDDASSRELLQGASNVYITTWAPQPILLRHPRLKLFITHGGYNSILEVAHTGKPVLLMPMMYDQTRNAGVVERNGWGKYVNKANLLTSSVQFEQELKELLENDKYEINAKRIQNLLKTKPFSADEVFIKHINFALANNGRLPELMSTAYSLNVFQQYNLDVWAITIFSVLASIALIVKIFVTLFKFILSFTNTKPKTQ